MTDLYYKGKRTGRVYLVEDRDIRDDLREVQLVAVIDPNSPKDVARLEGLLWETNDPKTAENDLATALRRYAEGKSPMPEMPIGMGAVVSLDGRIYMHVNDDADINSFSWRLLERNTTSVLKTAHSWREICDESKGHTPTVLFEGV